jgi:DNA-directed RNA polymerase specialized sigma24 family protein
MRKSPSAVGAADGVGLKARADFESFVLYAEPRLSRALTAALSSLTERQRLAVMLVHGYGYTVREVADLTGIKPTTVQNHLVRGLARLRAKLGVTDGE